jgi:hypothetical protein
MAPESDDRLDLGPLDPTQDALRFERMVRSVVARAVAQRPPEAQLLLVRWWGPALALAASLALAAWLPSMLRGSTQSSATSNSDPATVLLSWARSGGPSSASDVLDSLGEDR